jgi:hypothetical protein
VGVGHTWIERYRDTWSKYDPGDVGGDMGNAASAE